MHRRLLLLATLLATLFPLPAWGTAEIQVISFDLLGEPMQVGEMSPVSITVENTGDETVRDLKLVVRPPHSWEPLVQPDQPTQELPPGDQATIEFLLIPRFPGNQTAEFSVLYTDEGGNRTESPKLTETFNVLEAPETPVPIDPTLLLIVGFIGTFVILTFLLYRAVIKKHR
ncbi:MAG: NEW3 domain-containing protein [Candidatus Geothermarchaeales archaeon]